MKNIPHSETNDLIYEGIATLIKNIFSSNPAETNDLIYEGIATALGISVNSHISRF